MTWKNTREMIEEYLWVVGLGLIVSGIGQLFAQGWGVLIAGVIVTCVGVYLIARRKKSISDGKDIKIKLEKNWFKQFKDEVKKFKNINNALELVKFNSERQLKLPFWLLGLGITIFLSINISGITSSPIKLLKIIGITAFIISPLSLIIGIILLIKLVNINLKKIDYLYREKDKQEK